MKPCEDRKETLLLDVYGELSPEGRRGLERHLEGCEGCRREWERLGRLLQDVKEALPSPELTREEASTLADTIKKRLRGKPYGWRLPQGMFKRPARLIPVMAAACMLIMALGWFSIREFKPPPPEQRIATQISERQVISREMEILRNLELLEEMETIRKLVQAVDEKEVI